MTQVAALPRSGEVFLDARGEHRSLRVSWHPGDGVVVLSVWRADRCIATFRLDRADVPSLIDALGPDAGERRTGQIRRSPLGSV